MPQLFSKRNISDAENRLRLLFCVDALGPVTKEQLWPFAARLELMEYVPMCLYVDELVRDGSLGEGPAALQGALFLTDAGRRTLELFGKRLPQADASRIRLAAPDYAALLMEKRQIRAVHELATGRKYRVACSVTEGDVPTLFLRLETSSKRLAGGAIKRFRSRAALLLTCLYTLAPAKDPPPDEVEGMFDLKEALDAVTAETPLLCRFGGHQQAGVVRLKNKRADVRLALLLPSLEAATEWLASAQADPEGLLNRVCAILTGKEPPV